MGQDGAVTTDSGPGFIHSLLGSRLVAGLVSPDLWSAPAHSIEPRQRLTAAIQLKMAIAATAAPKLIHSIYGVLRNDTPVDPKYARQGRRYPTPLVQR